MSKVCPRCNRERGDSYHPIYCKECTRKYSLLYYKNHPDSINKSSLERYKKIRKVIIEAKSKPCKDCKKKYPYYVMEFDHLRDKKFQISIAANRRVSLEVLRQEIAKCDLVCANCHRQRTFSRIKLNDKVAKR